MLIGFDYVFVDLDDIFATIVSYSFHDFPVCLPR